MSQTPTRHPRSCTPTRRAAYVLAAAFCAALLPPPADAELTSTESALVDYVRRHETEAIELLERVVNINSGTMHHAGVREVGAVFAEQLTALGLDTRWIDMPEEVDRAGHLFARQEGERGRSVLLIGHLDTVFEPESPFQTFERVSKNVARGPGVNDMKGGLVLVLYALKAMHSVGVLDGAAITFALIGDEEDVGKPVSISRRELIDAAKRRDIALGFETATGLDTATIARRGSSGWTLEVSARQGHSSGIFSAEAGAGAIFEAARILDTMYRQVRGPQYLTFNPGIIVGGSDVTYDPKRASGTAFGKTNVIADRVVVDGGLRFIDTAQKRRARASIRAVVEGDSRPRSSAEVSFEDAYPAMPPTDGNRRLLKIYDRVSRDLGYGPVEAFDPGGRGAADISFVAEYVDGMDGIGVLGEGAHSREETIDLAAFPELTQRAAIFLYRLTTGARRSEREVSKE